jgi:hypothetical protein
VRVEAGVEVGVAVDVTGVAVPVACTLVVTGVLSAGMAQAEVRRIGRSTMERATARRIIVA